MTAAGRSRTVEVVVGGRSNLTYYVTSPAGSVVLRRPPLRAVRPTAHDMTREHRVLSRAARHRGPGAQAAAAVHRPGRARRAVLRDGAGGRGDRAGPLPGRVRGAPPRRAAMTDALVDVLADLHDVDPAAVGLTGFGRPDGYLDRQLRRWAGEWQALRTGDDLPGGGRARRGAGRRRCRRSRAGRSCTATTGWTTSCSTRPTRPGSRRCWTGRCPPSATRWPTSGCCSSTGSRPRAPVVTPSVTSLPGFPGPVGPGGPVRRAPGRRPRRAALVRRARLLQARRRGRRHRGPAAGRRDGRQHRRRARRQDRPAGRGAAGRRWPAGSTNRTVRNDPDREDHDRHKVRSGGYPRFG